MSTPLQRGVAGAAPLVALVACFAPAAAAQPPRDPEIRCCWTYAELRDELKGVFLIQLQGQGHPIGQLKLLTPTGAVLGYDEHTKTFSRPHSEGIYGLGPPEDMPMMDPEWHNSTPRTLALLKRSKGEYRLEVIGERDGNYALTFLAGGLPQTGPGARNSLVDRHFAEFIKAGETHVYVFPGEFADIYDGSIPLNSPSRFRVTRIQKSK